MITKDEVLEKLPLLVNGQLGKAQCAELEKAIQEDAELAREAEFLKTLHYGIKQQDVPLPGEIGLARLKRDIDKEKQKQTAYEKENNSGADQVQTISKTRYWKPLAIAASCLLAIQTMTLLPWQNTDSDATNIIPMSGSVTQHGPRVQAVIHEDATMTQLISALTRVNGSIVGGPSALGIVTLALPQNADAIEAMNTLLAYDFILEVSGL
ncbi:MAG: hypothetical protein ACI9Y1_002224 [Lentisphaeria bacterium]|jgi:hypothetical protein